MIWNHNMSAAPLDADILAAHPTKDEVYATRWNAPTKHTPSGWWSGFSAAVPPVAWQPWPEHPFAAATQGEAAAPAPANVSLPVDERSGEGASEGGGHVTASGNAHPISAGELVNSSPVFLLDDVGSGA